ncbi:hypothetical protein CLU96_1959 [Chryseobacterium sp. 52]|uniref:branched-chain amino acid ABC transporter substrate-binding protein n=1 Tax=Chryseobacterium sp. 52 TaxID=2035213 RepID=UPI000C194FEF|nr:branched-chain amino acid ABC transporter substrate-binding protein [Chryseobacterium sp. 52]PIF44960.1 hypothetical protein CLU96_1959 [Chryseobacterium sp. 52]
MAREFLEALGNVLNVLDLLTIGSSSSSASLNDDSQPTKRKKSKFFTEKISFGFMLAAAVLLFFVFKDPLPSENYIQNLIVGSLIGTALSCLFFFILYVLKCYYFKSLFKLLLFSSSVILFFISLVFFLYFRTGLFI